MTTEKRTRLVLLDTHAIIHRAYHAIPDFSSSKGEPTGALYGLLSILFKIIETLKPNYIVATQDLEGPTERHKQFAEYKGTRKKVDDELVVQIKHIPSVFEALGIPLYSHKGFEADDMLGTIVKQVEKIKNLEVIIASGDMDTLQLVSETRVRVFTPKKGLSDTMLYDEDAVKERFGFPPSLMTDYKGLRGDPSDNIPGIRGIGEKTATTLISHFGSLSHMYEALEKSDAPFLRAGITKRVVGLLSEGKKEALFSKSLATILVDAPIVFSLPKKEWHVEDHTESVSALCDRFDFPSLKVRLSALTKRQQTIEPEVKKKNEDSGFQAESAVALWLLKSDITNPTAEDVLAHTRATNMNEAHTALMKQLKETGRLYEVFTTIERPLVAITKRMHEVGIGVDVPYLKALAREYKKELAIISEKIFKHAGREFNINSPKQLGGVLFDELKLLLPRQKKTAGGARTTKESELVKMKELHPIVGEVLAYRELYKLLSTYIEKIPALVSDDGRLHARFMQAGTTTGRMSSQDPNLQNIPTQAPYGSRVREAFRAKNGFILASFDYSQIELRIASALSKDKTFMDAFKAGRDIHTEVASAVFGVAPDKVDKEMRRRAKVINFGILYGMGVNALREALGVGVSRDEAAEFLSQYFKNFSGLARYLEETKATAARLGYTETFFGRRRYFAGIQSLMPNIKAQAERMAINAPVQGTAADIIKLAMIETERIIAEKKWGDRAHLLLQVHDELVYELKEEKAEEVAREIKKCMEGVVPPSKLSGVPLIVDVAFGKTWGTMKARG
ncbi:MAG TPA: DNA polymerase [Candidatus Paceibacterota bacterium]